MLNDTHTAFVLASASPRRKELLSYLSLEQVYQYVVETDETIAEQWTPQEAVMKLSVNKALAVLEKLPMKPILLEEQTTKLSIIAADTIVVLDKQILGKPKDEQDAFIMLQGLQGRSHEVYTGLTLLSTTVSNDLKVVASKKQIETLKQAVTTQFENNSAFQAYGKIGQWITTRNEDSHPYELQIGYSRSHVTFRPLSEEQIWRYIETKDPLDKAGSYGIQGIGAVNVESINGDFYSVMGLPLSLLHTFIQKH